MDPNYEEIRSRITRRYTNRTEYLSHLAAFLIVNGIVWGIFQPVGLFYTVAAVVMGFWGMGITIHSVQFLMKEAQERAIEKAIEQERQWLHSHDNLTDGEVKRKRNRLTLNHDGELMDIVEDDIPARKHR